MIRARMAHLTTSRSVLLTVTVVFIAAVSAVAVGGWRRLAGPLFCGSALLAVVTFDETLRHSAGVPTWIWLAAAGTVLLGSGVAMELRGLGPVESGRRLVELVGERFE